ncbi:MAG TPA: SMC-Scp complex subunit ScpB [bacterium]|nr:SMC-Scp complex subunit ScpB [bacterium]HPN44129.1 SMC-Scp complex subunit ScpB [bacterium]
MESKQLKLVLESLIFASDSPLTVRQIMAILKDEEKGDIENALKMLEDDLDERAFFLNKVSNGYQFATKPEFSKWISQMHENKARTRLSRAALETLAIIAFKQPISRVEISAIRGVNSDGVIKNLLERQLITLAGRDKEHGRSLLFVTTNEFLKYFNLNDIADLPRPKEIEELLAEGEGGKILNNLPEEVIVVDENAEELPVLEFEELTGDDSPALAPVKEQPGEDGSANPETGLTATVSELVAQDDVNALDDEQQPANPDDAS